MNGYNNREKKEFLLKFCNSASMSAFKNAFSSLVGRKIHCLILDPQCVPLKNMTKGGQHITNFLKNAKHSPFKRIRLFNCSCNRVCLAIPIIQGDNIYGYIFALHLTHRLDKISLDFIRLFIDTSLKEFQKEQELSRLYDTIRPRAIALSTIHTIHRLLSSTLDMDELIERMARLTLQVLRARHCSIMLLDESKHYLIPKAVIDLKNNKGSIHRRHRKIKIGKRPEGKVAKSGKTRLTRGLICVPLVEEDIIGVICARNKTNRAHFNNFDLEILLTLAEQAVIAIKNAQLYEEQKKMAYGSIKSLAALLDAKSPHTYTHSEQFVKIVLAIAGEMGLTREEIINLRYAALLPDTGRFTIPDEILEKRGGLSRKEYSIIKKQHRESLKILEPLEFLRPAIPIIMYHHERYDGTGYPRGLRGKRIPIGARIMAVAEAFEAMLSSRPYKDTRISMQQAIKEIKNNRRTQFDPDVVDAFITVAKKEEFRKLFE